jgi:intron-binding protein aquarius
MLLQRPDTLQLVTGEMWPSARILSEEEGKSAPEATPMAGVEHLGQYVFEMTNTKVKHLRTERGLDQTELVISEEYGVVDGNEEEEGYVEPQFHGEDDEEEIEEEVKEGFEAIEE